MSENTVVAAVETGKSGKGVKGKGKHTGPKNAAVSAEQFLKVYLPAAKEGKSNKEIAQLLGMNLGSFSVRLSNLRKRTAEDCEAAKAAGKSVVNPFDAIVSRRGNTKKNFFAEGGLLARLGMLGGDVEVVEETPSGETVNA